MNNFALSNYKVNVSLIIIGIILATNDIISFGLSKIIHVNKLNRWLIIIPSLLYSLQIPIFFYGLNISTMTVLNLAWNLISNVFVTLLGLFYFQEKVTIVKKIGIIFAFLSLFLFTIDEI